MSTSVNSFTKKKKTKDPKIIINLLPCILNGVLKLEMDIDMSNGTHVIILTVK